MKQYLLVKYGKKATLLDLKEFCYFIGVQEPFNFSKAQIKRLISQKSIFMEFIEREK